MAREVNGSRLVVMLLVGLVWFQPKEASAHGVQCTVANGVAVQVQFEDGTAMAGANVKIYAPGNPEEPHFTTETNEKGEAFFRPHQEGRWMVVVRDGRGHGVRRDIAVDREMVVTAPKGHLEWPQKAVMALCVVWGLLGTALFFSSRKNREGPCTSPKES